MVRLSAPIKYENAGIDIEPPGTATATVDPATAYRNCLTGDAICEPGVSPDVMLAKVTDTNTGPANSDGSMKSTLKDTLSWVITYPDVPCTPTGAASTVAPDSQADRSRICTLVNFVSAANGDVLYSFQSTEP